MNLRLQHPPTPEFALEHAAIAVSVISNVEGTELDYSPDSLATIDKIINQFHDDKLTDTDVAETVFVFGCYAGEVFVRNLAALWVEPRDIMSKSKLKHFPFMVIQMPGGHVWSPISKAFKELREGSAESLADLYRHAVGLK